jgi:hypothetical protein
MLPADSGREDLMLTRAAFVVLALLTSAPRVPSPVASSHTADPADFAVHEWGTFTTVAGQDGGAIDWLPLGGPTDLPCFVEHFQDRRDVKIAPNLINALDYATARASLWGKVRMETPVLYFYTPRARTVSVRVRFPHGLMTEWYPHASVTPVAVDRNALRQADQRSVIDWPSVRVTPGTTPRFPVGQGASHYYAARNTDAAPILVNNQTERFLFYRGVASFDVPLAAAALGSDSVRVRTPGQDEIPGAILFENRHGAIGYRVLGALRRDVTVATPPAGRAVADVRRELEGLLVSGGLYPKEARAMVDTWRDSWFEDGTRVFYIVPRRAVDAILPLTITPAPDSIARVFVGRMEVITPDIERSVQKAIASNDSAELQRYGRFLGPITDRILAKAPAAIDKQRLDALTSALFDSYRKRVSACE